MVSLKRSLPPPATYAPRRVVVTGLGAVTPLANGMQATWERLLQGRCGIKRMRPTGEDPVYKVRQARAIASKENWLTTRFGTAADRCRRAASLHQAAPPPCVVTPQTSVRDAIERQC